MSIPVVYVAGPFRGPNAWEIEKNIRHAEEWSLEVWRAGGAALCPHTNTRFFQGAAPDEVWLDGDLALLAKCDAIFMIPGWERSSGANKELDYARILGIPVFKLFVSLKMWIREFRQLDCK
jgi:uncharacterized protein DUF4406